MRFYRILLRVWGAGAFAVYCPDRTNGICSVWASKSECLHYFDGCEDSALYGIGCGGDLDRLVKLHLLSD